VGVPANRNVGLRLARADMVLFLEDDVTIAPDYIAKLIECYKIIESFGNKIGGIGGKCIGTLKPGKLLAIEKSVADKIRLDMKTPSYISPFTGLVFHNFKIGCSIPVETDTLPPWSLFNKEALSEIGNYDEVTYNRFNYSHEETDMMMRLKLAGYKFYYLSKTVSYHNQATKGGTRTTALRYYYYFVASHMVYLVKNYKAKAWYMIPCCLGYLCWNGIIAGLRMVK
jgi:GT2 family glycosyltransferase